MIRLLRYLKGYVVFEAQNGFPERFLNLCKNNDINLWNIENDGVKVKACTDTVGFQKMKTPLENSGMTATTLKESGLALLLKRNKWRCGAGLGLVLVVLIVWLMSCFIWEVEIVKEKGVMVEGFTENLESLGIRIGAKKSDIDIPEVQTELLNRHSELNWVSVNIFGSKVQVEYTMVNKKTPSDKKSGLCNIVAKKNGRVTLVECYNGSIAVKEGAYVVKGSLLISGVVKNADLSENLTYAKGKVYALTNNTIKSCQAKSFKSNVTCCTEPLYVVNFFGVELPLGKKGDYSGTSISKINLVGNNTVLPIGVVRQDVRKTSLCEIALTDSQIQLYLLKKCVENKRENYNHTDIKKAVYSFNNTGEECTITAKIQCIEDIGAEKVFFTEEN